MEKGLIVRARKKDNEAIAEIIQLTERKAYFIAYKVVNNEATAKDIVQEAYIQAFQKLDQLSDDSKFESWFNQIVSHKALDYTKSKQGKNKPVEFSSLDDEEDRLEFEANIKNDKASFEPEASMNYKELQEGVQGVLSELPENQRLALMMYYFEDMSVSEIADVYGVSENTVKGYLAYGRKKIKTIIEAMREKGVSFYGVAPMPFLTWMLHDQMAKTAVSHVSKDIIIKTVGTSAAASTAGAVVTKTGASKSGFAKWWASKAASVKAGVCAGTVAVTGAVGYAAVDYNSNYKQVERAIEKLDELHSYEIYDHDLSPSYYNDEYEGLHEANIRMYIENTDSPDVYSVLYYANPEEGMEHNLFVKYDGIKMASCYSDANSFEELDLNLLSEYKEPVIGEDGLPYSEVACDGNWRLKALALAQFDTYYKNWFSLFDIHYKDLYGKDKLQSRFMDEQYKLLKERLNKATVTKKDNETIFHYTFYDIVINDKGDIQINEDMVFKMTITIDKDGYFKNILNERPGENGMEEFTIANMQKK